jgi:FkbM family methyltransferase
MFNVDDRIHRNILVSCDHGLMIINRFDRGPDGVSVGSFLLDHGNNNTVEADIAFRALANTDSPVVLDVGSNIGTFASWVSRFLSKKNGKLYCFEPQRQVFQMLCGNLAINNLFNVYAHELALGKEEKFIDIDEVDYESMGSFAAFSMADIDMSAIYKSVATKKQRIKMTTIDKFVVEYQLEKVDYIKVDAEGLDLEVLDGAKNTIETYSPDLYVEYLNLGSSKKEDTKHEGKILLENYLHNLGYETIMVHHDLFATKKPGVITKE